MLVYQRTGCVARAGNESGEEAAGQLQLAAVLAAADLAALGDVLCHRTDGLVFLLQALVAAPALVQVPSYLLCLSASSGLKPHTHFFLPLLVAYAAPVLLIWSSLCLVTVCRQKMASLLLKGRIPRRETLAPD